MAEIFGAVGTAIALLDLILKRIKTCSRFKKDAEGAVAEVSRLSQKMERRVELLRDLYAELHGLDFRGSSMAVRCLEACEHQIRELQGVLTLFECRLADGRSWWTLLTMKLEFAWKREDVRELCGNVAAANETLADGLRACQLYLARLSFKELREIRTHDLPALGETLREIRAEGLAEITRSITTSNAVEAGGLLQALGVEGQNTRETVIESGWTTTTEIRNLETSIGQMIISERDGITAKLLPALKQHMNGLQETYVQEFRALRDRTSSAESSTSPSSQATTDGPIAETWSPPLRCGPRPEGSISTKQSSAVQWNRSLPLGVGNISLRREVTQRILIRKRECITEDDTSIDQETTYIVAFIPNAWFGRNAMSGCNWKFSSKTSCRIPWSHPVWSAIDKNDVKRIIKYFDRRILSINDVAEYTGDSLLHIAVNKSRPALCEWLVDNGADPHATNDALKTAIYALADSNPPDGYRGGYEPLMNLLVGKCQLDPNDTNLDKMSVMERDFEPDVCEERFTRFLRLSLPLNTEPEGYRIQQLFHSIAARCSSRPAFQRLKCLVDEYHRLALPEEHESGKKWWHTPEFLRKSVELASDIFERGAFGSFDYGNANREWAKDQIVEAIRSGVCIHSEVEKETIFQYLVADGELPEKAGNINIADYFKKEQALHSAGGKLQHHHSFTHNSKGATEARHIVKDYSKPLLHYYHEYPVFEVEYNTPSDAIEITYGIVVSNRSLTGVSIPGSWELDAEIDICERRGFELEWREVEDGDWGYIGSRKGFLKGRYAEHPGALTDGSAPTGPFMTEE